MSEEKIIAEEIPIEEKRRSDLLWLDPRVIHVEEKFNTRVEFDLEDLLPSIKENNVVHAIKVWKVAGEEKYFIIDGERRWRCVMEILKTEGRLMLIPTLSLKKPNNEDRTCMLLTNNDGGKELTVVEKAVTVERLKTYGWSVEKIAEKIGKSPQHVYQMLNIANLPDNILEDIRNGILTAHKVIAVQNKLSNPDDITHVVNIAKEKANAKSAKLDKVPGGDGSCSLKTGKKKVSKIELDAADVEAELLAEGVKKPSKHKVTCCQTCPFVATRTKADVLEAYCAPINNQSTGYHQDELIITDEFENAKLPKDCPLKRYKFTIELA